MKICIVLTFILFVTLTATGTSNNFKVVSTVKESDRGLEPCLIQCFGTTGENIKWATKYQNFLETESIDISACEFKAGTTPMISMTVVGELAFAVGPASPTALSRTSYRVSLVRMELYSDIDLSTLKYVDEWRIDWVATGYTC